MAPTPTPDEELMIRYREGDLRAFEELYSRHRLGLYRFVAWRSPRADWVDEIVQDSWANLHHARGRYRPDATFRTYLYQIARNRLLDLVRQHQPLLAADMGTGTDGRSVFDGVADAAHDVATPEAVLDEKQRTSRLHAALAALPTEQKEAVVLQQFSGMSLDEIAVIVSAPVETVKSRLRYAMRKLREGSLSEQG
jgi:RNA polymerase sigma factor (sigma-70 family)